ncbi:MAG: rod shape-determining protein MreC [Lentimicrobiaceae bacterium]|nr:rod shape-determining protein MreC [Lentimicrobiaceae bacterium]
MTSFRDLLKRYFHLFVFLLLQLFALMLFYNNSTYQHFVISTAAQGIIGPLQKLAHNFYKHFQYSTENASLLQQNLNLLKEQEKMFFFSEDTVYSIFSGENKNKRRMYDIQTAHVVFNSINKAHNYIIIDKGSKDGVTPDMAVISPNGVAGVVSDVSKNFSTVISLLNPLSRVSAKILPINQIGTVVWLDSDPSVAQVIAIPQHLLVTVGDSVVTSGYSDVFPKDILIGTVIEKFDNPNNTFLTIKIRLATDFRNLHNVYLISNLYKPELDSLKSKFVNE